MIGRATGFFRILVLGVSAGIAAAQDVRFALPPNTKIPRYEPFFVRVTVKNTLAEDLRIRVPATPAIQRLQNGEWRDVGIGRLSGYERRLTPTGGGILKLRPAETRVYWTRVAQPGCLSVPGRCRVQLHMSVMRKLKNRHPLQPRWISGRVIRSEKLPFEVVAHATNHRLLERPPPPRLRFVGGSVLVEHEPNELWEAYCAVVCTAVNPSRLLSDRVLRGQARDDVDPFPVMLPGNAGEALLGVPLTQEIMNLAALHAVKRYLGEARVAGPEGRGPWLEKAHETLQIVKWDHWWPALQAPFLAMRGLCALEGGDLSLAKQCHDELQGACPAYLEMRPRLAAALQGRER